MAASRVIAARCSEEEIAYVDRCAARQHLDRTTYIRQQLKLIPFTYIFVRLPNGPVWVQILAYAYVVSLLLFLHSVKAHEFIYFQF